MKALKKLLVIIYCVSFLGMTVIPSSAVPCCCKSRSSSATYEFKALDEASPPIKSCCSVNKVQAPSCCAIPTPLKKPCDLTRGENLECGNCSCLKHLQLVGISENLTNERLSKTVTDLPTAADTFTFRHPEHLLVVMASVIPTTDQTFILNCSLRF
ncbi:MAG: hypothetical protein V1897_16225 [Pseudomonadota bacterium]